MVSRVRIYVFTAPTAGAIQIFGSNHHRIAYAILNNGTYNVEFVDSPQGNLGSGYPLEPTDMVFEDDVNSQGELWVIADTCDTELRVWEVYDA